MHKLNRLALGAVVVTVATSTLGLSPAAAAAPRSSATSSPSAVHSTQSSLSVGICRRWPRLCGTAAAPVAMAQLTR